MPQSVRIRLTPEDAFSPEVLRRAVLMAAGRDVDGNDRFRVRKRSLDARKHPIYQLDVDVFGPDEVADDSTENPIGASVHNAPEVAVVGMGPAGLFAALRLVQLGFKPIIFERGKDVRARRRDLALLTREHIVNEDSNYCFGEGGAGTYSDGKLYTRSLKRGDVRRVLEWFVSFGADRDILVDAHPHIGTNRLPQIITAMREALLAAGAEVHFETRVLDIETLEGSVSALLTTKGRFPTQQVILATGHSARDIFRLIHKRGWQLTAKPFALGVRVEHPQRLIDRIQYKCESNEFLPPASYSLVHQADGRGVYSFCMCPGGIIAPCATSPGEVVTNGWSPSRRNNPFANSGMVVSVDMDDFSGYGFEGPLAAMEFQSMVERACCKAAGGTQAAPAQRLTDFVKGVKSDSLPDCSYKPGLVSVNLRELLPREVADRLATGFEAFGRKMRGFMTPEAIVVAPESRTSSPVRIPRDPEGLHHPEVRGLYPCGEGAGYAGGIASAAMDGIRVADRIAAVLHPPKANDQNE